MSPINHHIKSIHVKLLKVILFILLILITMFIICNMLGNNIISTNISKTIYFTIFSAPITTLIILLIGYTRNRDLEGIIITILIILVISLEFLISM